MKWCDGKGGFSSVQAHSRGISPIFDRDTLIAIATSMDPEFDVTTLDEVEGSGGGSTGVARELRCVQTADGLSSPVIDVRHLPPVQPRVRVYLAAMVDVVLQHHHQDAPA